MAELTSHQLWNTFSKALGTEMREGSTIRGISGQDHPVQAISVDDKSNRVLIISAESSPRIAALVQADIQATFPDSKVLMARPVLFDVAELARRTFSALGPHMNAAQMSSAIERFGKLPQPETNQILQDTFSPIISPFFETAKRVQLPVPSLVVGFVQQLVSLDWQHLRGQGSIENLLAAFMSIMSVDSAEEDRRLGVCAIPIYEFADADWDVLLSSRTEDLKERLISLGIYQYFYPPADQVALGSIDRGIAKRSDIIEIVRSAPILGHPLAPSELVASGTDLVELVDALADKGYVADVNHDMEVSPQGMKARLTIKTRPREGVLTKLVNRFTVKASVNVRADTRDLTGLSSSSEG